MKFHQSDAVGSAQLADDGTRSLEHLLYAGLTGARRRSHASGKIEHEHDIHAEIFRCGDEKIGFAVIDLGVVFVNARVLRQSFRRDAQRVALDVAQRKEELHLAGFAYDTAHAFELQGFLLQADRAVLSPLRPRVKGRISTAGKQQRDDE